MSSLFGTFNTLWNWGNVLPGGTGQPDYHIELSTTDENLKTALRDSRWLQGRQYSLPPWLAIVADIQGIPNVLPKQRLVELREGAVAQHGNVNERRFIRNRAVIKQIAADLERTEAIGSSSRTENVTSHGAIETRSWKQKKLDTLPSTAPTAPPGFQSVNCLTTAATVHRTSNPLLDKSSGVPTSLSFSQPASQKTLLNAGSSEQLHPSAPPFVPQKAPVTCASNPSSHSQTATRISAPSVHSSNANTEQEEADQLRKTVLAPFYDRIKQDTAEITRLREEKIKMTEELEEFKRIRGELVKSQPGVVPDNVSQELVPHGMKRKASEISPMRFGDATNGNNEHTAAGHLTHLANEISKDLGKAVPNETIQLCGLAPLKIMEQRPDDVLEFAHQKLHTWPYREVPTSWRRLYEDASLSKAAALLKEQAKMVAETGAKRRRIANADREQTKADEDWLAKIVKALDMGIMLSGTPGRSETFDSVFQQLTNYADDSARFVVPLRFNIVPPGPLLTEFPIQRATMPLSHEGFQRHLDTSTTPLIIPGTLAQWPASHRWNNPIYFLKMTLGGRRLVPVEVGKAYTDSEWGQKVMPFGEFMKDYLIPAKPKEIGYLAQHDLFAQIPALKEDITTPDYCYTTPPDPSLDDATYQTIGLTTAPALDQPLLNAWLGPKGTKTPLHTDPYHNILCQVVGYKYVRLYSPTETPNLYPRGMDGKGVSMENTAQVDVSHVRSRSLGGSTDLDAIREQRNKFPLFEQAKFVEGILAPGECVYVPLGWWHYVEGLTTGFSVSFWWN